MKKGEVNKGNNVAPWCLGGSKLQVTCMLSTCLCLSCCKTCKPVNNLIRLHREKNSEKRHRRRAKEAMEGLFLFLVRSTAAWRYISLLLENNDLRISKKNLEPLKNELLKMNYCCTKVDFFLAVPENFFFDVLLYPPCICKRLYFLLLASEETCATVFQVYKFCSK